MVAIAILSKEHVVRQQIVRRLFDDVVIHIVCLTVQRIVFLLSSGSVAAEGIGPYEIIFVVDGKVDWKVVQYAKVLVGEARAAAHGIRNKPTLELDVLEIIRALVAVFVFHEVDGALTILGNYLFRFDWAGPGLAVDLARFRVILHEVGADLFVFRNGLGQSIVFVQLACIPKDVGRTFDIYRSDFLQSITIVLFDDESSSRLGPLFVFQTVFQFPCFELGGCKVVVAFVVGCVSVLIEVRSVVGTDNDIELIASRMDCTNHRGNRGVIVGDAVPSAGYQVAAVA